MDADGSPDLLRRRTQGIRLKALVWVEVRESVLSTAKVGPELPKRRTQEWCQAAPERQGGRPFRGNKFYFAFNKEEEVPLSNILLVVEKGRKL